MRNNVVTRLFASVSDHDEMVRADTQPMLVGGTSGETRKGGENSENATNPCSQFAKNCHK